MQLCDDLFLVCMGRNEALLEEGPVEVILNGRQLEGTQVAEHMQIWIEEG